MATRAAKRLLIKGIVQGVGFRPFVYQTAAVHKLFGEIVNTNQGVTITVEGSAERIDAFIADLRTKSPPLAHITNVLIETVPAAGKATFTIGASNGQTEERAALISPDAAVCRDCLRELFDPEDRRYRYPFINCTNCGPRYTIVDDIPYDRPNTSMKGFKMCPSCQAEYDTPSNRRFHAQPNACVDCGPQVSLTSQNGERIPCEDPIRAAAALLKEGRIVAIKGLGGFHLAVDAENGDAVLRLRSRKHRDEKPFALMVPNLDAARQFAWPTGEEEALLSHISRPIVLLKKKRPHPLSPQISPRNNFFGVMLPYTPLHYLLLQDELQTVVMTSGNMSEEPIAIDNDEAVKRLGHIADYFLVHDRDILLRSDDSITRRAGNATRFLRRSRGYVPTPIFLKAKGPQVLAVGGELKNTVCLTKEDLAFLSQHIGDMENPATEHFFQSTISRLEGILDIHPEVIAHDLHPDYLTTRFAENYSGAHRVGVQHHHAHIAGCMAENNIDGPAIGLAFDGTGYGTDGTIWGGELLIADFTGFERAAHLRCTPMPGGAAAIREPWRMAVAYLQETFGDEFREYPLPLMDSVASQKIDLIVQMTKKRINTPLTSSLGRLFDAVAAIIGIRQAVRFEGQAAMELEMIAAATGTPLYDYAWTTGTPREIDTAPLIRGVVTDVARGEAPDVISARFHHTLIHQFADLCQLIGRETGLERVVLSGGVFQNTILLEGLMGLLAKKGFTVYTHTLVPCNDGGLSLGQAAVACGQSTTR